MDLDDWTEVFGASTFVTGGSANISKGFVTVVTTTGIINTTPMPWTQYASSAAYTAGSGLTLTGNVFSVGTGQITNTLC